jgi:hypothetical protein
MKYYLLLFLSSLLLYEANSQNLKLKAGFGYNKSTGKNFGNILPPFHLHELSVPNFGIAKEWQLGKGFNFQLEGNYTSRAFRTQVDYVYRTGYQYAANLALFSHRYLEVPAQLKINGIKNRIGGNLISFNFGGYVAKRIKNHVKMDPNAFFLSKGKKPDPIGDFNQNLKLDVTNSKGIDYGLNIGLTYNFSKIPISIDLKYNYGLVNQQLYILNFYENKIYSQKDFAIDIHGKEDPKKDILKPNRNLELAIYYHFNLNKK